DENDRAVLYFGRRPSSSKQYVASVQLQPLADGHLFDDRVRNAKLPDDIMVEHLDAARSNRTHRELRVTGYAEFPHEEGVERRTKPTSHFVRHGHSASWQTEHHDVLATGVLHQLVGKPPSSVCAVTKTHGLSPPGQSEADLP